ncbi:MAG: hypothetical protein JJE12_07225 [Anaerolineales bacterium]|nr:hypothetical protein [Anaerolineales bacterium]
MPLTRKLLFPILIMTSVLIAACASADESKFPTPLSNQVETHADDQEAGEEHTHLDGSESPAALSVVMVPSELVVGPNRFAIGIFDAQENLIHDAAVHFHYYDLRDPEKAVYESEADAQLVQDPEGLTTIYTHDRDFNLPGLWGVEIEVVLPDGSVAKERMGLEISADSATLSPGDKAPALNTQTIDDVGENLNLLTSAEKPIPEMHKLSLAQALANDKPTLLLLATPAFCQTRFCGPAYEMVGELQKEYAGQVNFVYVEVFDGLPDPGAVGFQPSAAAQEFGIESEPWAYFIDQDGTIVYRLEGLFSYAELELQIQKRLDL